MKTLTTKEFAFYAVGFYQMMQKALEQERKHAENARCKPANWIEIGAFLDYALGERPTNEEIQKLAGELNFKG